MKWRRMLVLAALIGVSGSPAFGQSVSVALTLEQAVAEALVRNPRALDAEDRVREVEFSRTLALSAFSLKATPMMQGSFGQSTLANQTYGVGISQLFRTGTEVRGNLTSTSHQNQLGTYYFGDSTILITQPLLRGFGRESATRPITASALRAADAVRQRAITEQQVALSVASSFYGVIAQRQFTAIARSAVGRSQALLDAARAKLAAGRVSQLDVLRAEQLVAQAEAQLLDSETALDDRLDDLRGLMFRGSDLAIDVQGEIPTSVSTATLDESIGLAHEQRLELHTATDAWQQAERDVRLARRATLPQLDVSLALTRREVGSDLRSSVGFDKFRVATFAGISMPLERTAQRVGEQTAALEVDRRHRALESLRLSISQEVRSAARRHERAKRALELAGSSVDFARREAELADLRNARGFSNNLDVVTAEGNLLAAEGRRLALAAELAVSRLHLMAVTGSLDPRRDVH